jgi:hypothetical protein
MRALVIIYGCAVYGLWRSSNFELRNYLLRAATVAGDAVEERPIRARDVVDHRRELQPQHHRRRILAGPEGGWRRKVWLLCLRAHMVLGIVRYCLPFRPLSLSGGVVAGAAVLSVLESDVSQGQGPRHRRFIGEDRKEERCCYSIFSGNLHHQPVHESRCSLLSYHVVSIVCVKHSAPFVFLITFSNTVLKNKCVLSPQRKPFTGTRCAGT